MEFSEMTRYAGAVVAALGGPAVLKRIAQSLFPDQSERLRTEIGRNLDLLARLPDGSEGQASLRETIDRDVLALTTEAREARRDPMTITLGLLFLLGAVGAVRWALATDGWWQLPIWILVSMLLLFGGTALIQGGQKTLRDEKNRSVR